MSRSYRHIQEYEKVLELKEQGFARKQIGEEFGFKAEQLHAV